MLLELTRKSGLIRCSAFVIAGLLAWGAAVASDPPLPTRRDTLSLDLAGPAVEWIGEIAASLRDDGDTCFILRQTADESGHTTLAAEPFVACALGFFDPAIFGAGRELRVKGNLGPALPRRIGGSVLNHPVVAGAFIELLPPRPRYYYGPPSRYYYDPFYYPYRPYYPYYGPPFYPWPWPPYYRPWP